MTQAANFDVLIVGAGMVGATIACGLGQHGLKVGIVDQQLPEPFDANAPGDLRVSALNHASQKVLERVGAWPFMQHMRMTPFRTMAVWEKPLSLWQQQLPTPKVVFNAEDVQQSRLGFVVENRITQLGLHERMQQVDNITLFCPVTIESLTTIPTPCITLIDGTVLSAPLIIGADGANSAVRETAGIHLKKKPYGQHCFVMTVEIAGGVQDITWQAFTPTGPEAFLPLADADGKSYASLCWYHTPEKIAELMALPEEQLIAEVEATFPPDLPAILRITAKGSFPLIRRHAQHYFADNVVLAGDSAHTINPLAGQGVNLGLMDAGWLIKTLLDAHNSGKALNDSAVLAVYEQRRRKENQLMMSTMDAFYFGFSNNITPLKVLRNVGFGVASQLTPVMNQVVKYAIGLNTPSPLSP